jgi:putative ABC transport system permease protein
LLQFGLAAMASTFGDIASGGLLRSFWIATFTGLICAITFAIYPLAQLINTSALWVIRGQSAQSSSSKYLSFLPPLFGLLLLLYFFSADLKLTLVLMLSIMLVVAILVVLARLIMLAGRQVGSSAGQAFHLAIANLKRRANENSIQLVSFTLAIQLLLLLLVVRNELIDEWQAQLPEFTANRFLVNVKQTEVPEINQFLQSHQIKSSQLYPVVRGRLTAVNGEKLRKKASKEESNTSDQGRTGIGRELNLTWQESVNQGNDIVAGEAWQKNANAQVSIEQGIAKRLDIKLGDTLTFQIGSDEFSVPVTSIRKVQWQSMKPNFFMIFNPAVLKDFPSTYIASLYVDNQSDKALQQMLRQHPTVTVIDVDAMIKQLRSVINQVSIAIQFILVLVVLAGSLVLIAQVQASMEQRERELAILRTLGAKGRLLKHSVLFEFMAQGAIAGLLASATMEIAVYFIQRNLFEMTTQMHWNSWIIGIFSGALFVGAIGYFSCRRLLQLSSVTLIRRTM